ncbi:MAG: SDR family NAD(P)-dependent oxidoreductase [Anaerolineales bacterium]|nr:SDR family NAD(P)-dependent oxidoreductase [Anaerolineales bacterium]
MNLTNKLMLITGASSGIGAATARLAARAGARVILVARSQDKLEQLAAEIRQAGGQAFTHCADLTHADAVSALEKRVSIEWGTPDILFNNAGAGRWLYVDETSTNEAENMIAAPYLSAFYVTRAFLPAMMKRNSGLIINMSSIAGYMSWPGATAYTAARWAMRGFHAGLRADLHRTKIRTMLTAFAEVKSEFWQNNPGSQERLPGAQKMIPSLTSEQAAQAILTGIRWNAPVVFAPFMLWVVLTLNYLFPQITEWLVFNTGHKRSTFTA